MLWGTLLNGKIKYFCLPVQIYQEIWEKAGESETGKVDWEDAKTAAEPPFTGPC